MAERPTFSPFWHRVRALRPRLRAHVQITRQHYRGRRWHVVHDPATNQFYRLNPIAHEFVGMLDGRRTVEDVWRVSLTRHGDSAPTQNEVIQLLSQLYNANLLSADTSPETEQLLRRGRERFKRKAAQQAIGIMYFRMRLFNPDRYLAFVEPILRPILNRWGLLVWAAFVIFAFAKLWPEAEALWQRGFDVLRNPAMYPWLIVVFIVTKAIHETGHGVICRKFGGQVPEFGVMLLVLFPAPYVDASAAWAMPSKWQRVAIGAGGMIFELFVAGIAALIWLNTPDGAVIHDIAYNAIFTASISTILFNANPLMRFDGYYILSDLLEMPNLMHRSTMMLKYLVQRYVYRLKQTTPPTTIRAEQTILVIYGIAALAYRIFLFFSITLYVMTRLFAIGLILAVWTASAWFIIPIGKFIHWNSASPQLADSRARCVWTSVGLVAAALVLVGAIPMPDHRRGSGVVESIVRDNGVYFGTDGFVTEARKRPGDPVSAGEAIVVCDSPLLRAQLAAARAEFEKLRSLEMRAWASNPAAGRIASEKAAAQAELLRLLEHRIEMLTVRAPHGGTVVGPDPAMQVGSYVQRGQPLCEVVDADTIRIAAVVNQTEANWLYELDRARYDVQIRSVADAARVIEGGRVTVPQAGRVRMPHAALGYGGGGPVEVSTEDRSGLVAKRHQFIVHVAPVLDEGPPLRPGERVKLRFTLPEKPLLVQWADRLHKLIQGRVNI